MVCRFLPPTVLLMLRLILRFDYYSVNMKVVHVRTLYAKTLSSATIVCKAVSSTLLDCMREDKENANYRVFTIAVIVTVTHNRVRRVVKTTIKNVLKHYYCEVIVIH